MRTVPNLETMRANGSLEDLDFSSDGKLVAAVVVVLVVRLWVAGALLVRLNGRGLGWGGRGAGMPSLLVADPRSQSARAPAWGWVPSPTADAG